jgi:hypothetical protein
MNDVELLLFFEQTEECVLFIDMLVLTLFGEMPANKKKSHL